MTGKEFKIRRIILDIRANEIAERIGVSKSYISLMEKGERNIPLHIRDRWMDVLGL